MWPVDFARLRRAETMPAVVDRHYTEADPRLPVDGVAGEAAAWTPEELREALAETRPDLLR